MSLTNMHLYNVVSQAGAWTNRINGAYFWSTNLNSFKIEGTPLLGGGGNLDEKFHGDIAEFLLFKRILTAAERATVQTYLNRRYSLWIP